MAAPRSHSAASHEGIIATDVEFRALLLILALGASDTGSEIPVAVAVGGSRGIRNCIHCQPLWNDDRPWCGLPAIAFCWLGGFQDSSSPGSLPPTRRRGQCGGAAQIGLFMNDVRNLLAGGITAAQAGPGVARAAEHFAKLRSIAAFALTGLILAVAIVGILIARARISPTFRARNVVEVVFERLLLACSTIAVFVAIGILLSVVYESVLFFRSVPVQDFLFGTIWSPQTALRTDQVGSSGSFGAVPLFLGTAMISGIAMLIAVPVGLLSAVYLSEYADRRFRAWAKPLLEILAGIPTVVYGFFAALTVGPALRVWGESMGLEVASESALRVSSTSA